MPSRKPEAVITRLRASNFRSIESIDLELGPLNVLVGQNGVGKSNIVDVLRFVRDCINRSVEQALLDRGGLAAIQRLGARAQDSDVRIELQYLTGMYDVEYGFALTRDPLTEYKVKTEHLRIYERGAGILHVDLRLDGGRWVAPATKAHAATEQLSALTLHLARGWLMYVPRQTRATYRAAVDVTLALSDMSFYNIAPESLRAPQQVLAESPFDEKGRNLSAVLRAIKKENGPELIDVVGALARLVDGLRGYEIQNVGSYLVARLHYAFHDSRTHTAGEVQHASDLGQESDGTLRILSILAALYQRPSRPLIVIEEPETNIHPGALGVIADLLQEASLRSQILVTTHNPDLVEHFEPEVLRVVEKSDGVTHVGPVAHDQLEAIRQMLFSTAEIMKMEGLRRETAGV